MRLADRPILAFCLLLGVSAALRGELAARYGKVQEWPFGQVFRVHPELPPASDGNREREQP